MHGQLLVSVFSLCDKYMLSGMQRLFTCVYVNNSCSIITIYVQFITNYNRIT